MVSYNWGTPWYTQIIGSPFSELGTTMTRPPLGNLVPQGFALHAL
jgi:hypothetical protein